VNPYKTEHALFWGTWAICCGGDIFLSISVYDLAGEIQRPFPQYRYCYLIIFRKRKENRVVDYRSLFTDQNKNKAPVLMSSVAFLGCKTKTGLVRFFLRQAFVQPYHVKGLGESFPLMWLNVCLC